jgi:hypothetical protein
MQDPSQPPGEQQQRQSPQETQQGTPRALDDKQVETLSKRLMSMGEQQRAEALEELKQYLEPDTLNRLHQALTRPSKKSLRAANKPLPEQKPPRRTAGII